MAGIGAAPGMPRAAIRVAAEFRLARPRQPVATLELRVAEVELRRAAEAGKANSGGATTLPAGWEEVIDDCSGQAYYWQRSTGHTSWVPPGGSRAEPSSHRETAAQAQKRKRENRRRKGNASSQARERITAKFLAKLNLKDQQIGGLQALFANSVTMGQLRESERDKAQENKGGKGVGRSDLWGGRVF